MANVEYKELRRSIIRGCRANGNGIEFHIDYERMVELASQFNLLPLKMNLDSKQIEEGDIPFISEYFEKQRLAWISGEKFFTVITFVDKDAITPEDQETIDIINSDEETEYDIPNCVASIIASLPCYFATIVSYNSNDPKRINRPTYDIVCRANKVTIRANRESNEAPELPAAE